MHRISSLLPIVPLTVILYSLPFKYFQKDSNKGEKVGEKNVLRTISSERRTG
jgi:hypothetical protein